MGKLIEGKSKQEPQNQFVLFLNIIKHLATKNSFCKAV